MRSHTQIVTDAGADAAIAELIGANVHQVRDWRLRDSIPAEWWARLTEREFTSLEELAAAAERKRLAPVELQASA